MKSAIKNSIASLSYYSGITSLRLRARARRNPEASLIILIYHRLTTDIKNEINNDLTISHPAGNFLSEMQFLRRHFDIITLDKAIDLITMQDKMTKPAAAITFDDGFEDNYTLAFPILKKLGIPATIFLTAEFIGTDMLPWPDTIGESLLETNKSSISLNSVFSGKTYTLTTMDKKQTALKEIISTLRKTDNQKVETIIKELKSLLGYSAHHKKKMLSWEQIRKMQNHDITFGAHTMTHAVLSKMPLEQAKKEISDSKKRIEGMLKTPVKHFAFPFGAAEDFNNELKKYCAEIGFKSVCTAIYGTNFNGADAYALKRLSPAGTLPMFAYRLLKRCMAHG